MEYFIMEPDKRLNRLPKIRKPAGFAGREQHKPGTAPLILYVENLGFACQYGDYLLKPFPMIGEKLHKVMEKYQRDMLFLRVILMEKERNIQHIYYRIWVPEIDCTWAAEPDCNRTGKVTEVILNPGQVGDAKIFRVKEPGEKLLVRLDVAESILRREPEGIWFTPVKTSGSKSSK